MSCDQTAADILKENESLRAQLTAANAELLETNEKLKRVGICDGCPLAEGASADCVHICEAPFAKQARELLEARKDKERLETLLNLTDIESRSGEWKITLRYNNYQDIAQIVNGDGEVVSECGDVDKEPNEQFRDAIDAAITKTKGAQP